MAQRNSVKIAENADVNRYYCMTIKDFDDLYAAYGQSIGELVYKTFCFGYSLGKRAEKSEMKRRASSHVD